MPDFLFCFVFCIMMLYLSFIFNFTGLCLYIIVSDFLFFIGLVCLFLFKFWFICSFIYLFAFKIEKEWI